MGKICIAHPPGAASPGAVLMWLDLQHQVIKIAHGQHSIATDILALIIIHNLLADPVLRRSVNRPVLIWVLPQIWIHFSVD